MPTQLFQPKIPTFDKDFFDEYKIYIRPTSYTLSSKRIESYKKIAYIQTYFQCNPIKFIDLMFNIELLDAQALLTQRSWWCPNVLAVCSRGFGKSTVIDLITMSKGMLCSNDWTYIASGTGSQAEQTFETLEKLANDTIDTFSGSTGYIFKDELVQKNATGDGFSHSSNGFNYSLYNGSTCQTLNSNINRKRGLRGSVIFDECGFLSEEMINVYSAFAIVEKGMRTGKDSSGNSIDSVRQRTFPTDVPSQKFYISSASSTSTQFYKLYRLFAKKCIMGDPDYCILHIDCEQMFHPTLRGEVIAPLLSRATVENEMKTNPEKGRREYYCQFTSDAGVGAIIRRGVITRNEKTYIPVLCNSGNGRKYIIAYDPARSRDNSVIIVCEVYEEYENNVVDTKMRIVNLISLVDVGKKLRTPMRTPEQIDYLKKIIIDYDGGTDAYDNIVAVLIDAGAGGGGVNIADYLMPDWVDEAGTKHRGLIDKENGSDYLKDFPNAVDKIKLMQPTAFKSIMYEAMIELIDQNKVLFTSTYDNKGYLTFFDINDSLLAKEKIRITEKLRKKNLTDTEYDLAYEEEMRKIQSVNTKIVKLNWQEELALANIDALKEELVNMVRKKRESGKDSFELTPEKENILHDDRAYTLCMACYMLSLLRKKVALEKPKDTSSILLDKLKNTIHRSTLL